MSRPLAKKWRISLLTRTLVLGDVIESTLSAFWTARIADASVAITERKACLTAWAWVCHNIQYDYIAGLTDIPAGYAWSCHPKRQPRISRHIASIGAVSR